MLTLVLGPDWVENRACILRKIARNVAEKNEGQILIVPELISHEMERRLCAVAGDTTSRFAEVLPFTRLARRVADAVGHAAQECLDNGGRIVAMASAVRQLHSKLKAYAAVETKPEFLTGLLDTVNEFKQCCITSNDLKNASKNTTGSLAQKLEELALILECYDAICEHGKKDPADQMSWLLGELEDSSFAQKKAFYIDGFPDFTRQHMEIIAHFIRNAPDVIISLTCDAPGSELLAFEKSGATANELIRIAKQAGIEINICHVAPRENRLISSCQLAFQGDISAVQQIENLFAFRAESVYQECLVVAEQIRRLVEDGVRYRQIGVVCADMSCYRNILEMVFERCHIPAYLSGTEEISDKAVIGSVLSALDAALGGFEQRDVIRYLRSLLSPLSSDISDKLENYAIIWSVDGSGWTRTWCNHPKGLGAKWTDRSKERLEELEAARKILIDPLVNLRSGMREASTVGEQVVALYSFLNEIHLDEQLAKLASRFDAAGDSRNAQILNQLWDILIGALEQLHDILGSAQWDADVFTRLLKLLLSQYDVGTIPPVLDSVTVGSVNAMQCQRTQYLFVMGALEGNLPGYGSINGVLSDQERHSLREMGVPVSGGAVDGIKAEFAEIYGALCGAEKRITITYPSGQSSFIYRRLAQLAGGEQNAIADIGMSWSDSLEAGAWLVYNGTEEMAAQVGVLEDYKIIRSHADYDMGSVSRENIHALYGDKLTMSASQIDKQAQCRLAYFLRYGIHAEERKSASVDPAEFGTYVHAVLENTAKKIVSLGGFQAVSLDETLKIAADFSAEYAKEYFAQLDTSRAMYLFERNSNELEMIVTELWTEMRASKFMPVGFEVGFGEQLELPPILFSGQSMKAQLRGFVDRVDTWSCNGNDYFRVVDYKTGKKDFDYCDIYNGLGLQMLLYLYALESKASQLIGENPYAAGVQYFPARAPLFTTEGRLTDEEADEERVRLWKRKGLLLNNDIVLDAMSTAETENRMPYTRKKDGTISGELASKSQLDILKRYIFKLLGRMVDEIASGCVKPNPYTRGTSHNACAYCPYGSVCHKTTVDGRRNYKAMTAQRFWEEIEKEVTGNG